MGFKSRDETSPRIIRQALEKLFTEHILQIPRNEVEEMEQNELPLGFAFTLAQDPEAMKRFSQLSQEERFRLLQRAHSAESGGEMQALVEELSSRD